MTRAPGADRPRAVVLDIEGTTAPLAFVRDVLFPFARAHASAFLANPAPSPEERQSIAALREEMARELAGGADQPTPPTLHSYFFKLMDDDRKSTALKRVQGLMWERGFRDGRLTSEVYPDVPHALAAWRRAGVPVAIYSSGSRLAQRLLFAHTSYGDLTPFLTAFFDTEVGPKTSSDSYREIARALTCPPDAMLFVSDVAAELEAALGAGYAVRLSVRPENPAQPGAWEVAHTLTELTDVMASVSET